jgi:hypothetical protein
MGKLNPEFVRYVSGWHACHEPKLQAIKKALQLLAKPLLFFGTRAGIETIISY